MSGTNAVAAKRALVALLGAAPDLGGSGVSVTYGWPGPEPPREFVYMGRAAWQGEPLRFQSAGQPLPRDELLTVDVFFQVAIPGGDVEDAEDRAVELGGIAETALALDPKMSSLPEKPPGLMIVTVVGGELDQDFDDEQAYARLIYQVRFRSELT